VSGFLPRILGILLIAAGFAHLADSLTPLLLPNYEDVVGRIAASDLIPDPAAVYSLYCCFPPDVSSCSGPVTGN
jgi:hypothetical protein